MKELKPCPFCGGDASLIVKTFFGLPEEDIYAVACNDCKSQSCYSDDRKETVKVWNTRPAEDEMYRVLSGICFEKSARICDYAPESCKVCAINKALKKARGTGCFLQ